MMNLTVSVWPTARCSGLIGNPETGQRHASEADAEFLQRRAARDRLGHALGEFIELVVHNFPFVLVCCFFCTTTDHTEDTDAWDSVPAPSVPIRASRG